MPPLRLFRLYCRENTYAHGAKKDGLETIFFCLVLGQNRKGKVPCLTGPLSKIRRAEGTGGHERVSPSSGQVYQAFCGGGGSGERV